MPVFRDSKMSQAGLSGTVSSYILFSAGRRLALMAFRAVDGQAEVTGRAKVKRYAASPLWNRPRPQLLSRRADEESFFIVCHCDPGFLMS